MAWDISSVNFGSVKSILLVADFVNCQYVWCWQPFPLLSQRCGSIFGWSLNWYIQASTWLYRCPSQVPTGALHTNVGSNGRLYVSWCQQPLSISSMASKSKQRSATMQIQEALRLRDEYHTWHTPGRRLEDKHPPLYLSVRCLCANCHCLSMIFASTSSSWFYMTQTSQDRKERSASKYITLARGISQSLHFIKSERCSQLVFRWNAFHLGTHIHRKIFVNESLLHSCLDIFHCGVEMVRFTDSTKRLGLLSSFLYTGYDSMKRYHSLSLWTDLRSFTVTLVFDNAFFIFGLFYFWFIQIVYFFFRHIHIIAYLPWRNGIFADASFTDIYSLMSERLYIVRKYFLQFLFRHYQLINSHLFIVFGNQLSHFVHIRQSIS